MEHDESKTKTLKQISYSLRLSNDLHRKLEKHLKIVQEREFNAVSQQKWIIDAIKERLTEEEDMPPEEFSKGKFVNVRIDKRLYDKIECQVEKMKIIRKSYSKKQWLVEALYAKLNRELD